LYLGGNVKGKVHGKQFQALKDSADGMMVSCKIALWLLVCATVHAFLMNFL